MELGEDLTLRTEIPGQIKQRLATVGQDAMEPTQCGDLPTFNRGGSIEE